MRSSVVGVTAYTVFESGSENESEYVELCACKVHMIERQTVVLMMEKTQLSLRSSQFAALLCLRARALCRVTRHVKVTL